MSRLYIVPIVSSQKHNRICFILLHHLLAYYNYYYYYYIPPPIMLLPILPKDVMFKMISLFIQGTILPTCRHLFLRRHLLVYYNYYYYCNYIPPYYFTTHKI